MKNLIIANFGITKEQLPLYYIMTKCCPKMIELNVDSIDLLELKSDNTDINNTEVRKTDDSNSIIPSTATSFIDKEFSSKPIRLNDTFNQMNTSKKMVKAYKIKDSYNTYLNMLVNKFKEYTVDAVDHGIIVLDSYNGAEYRNIKKSKNSIILVSLKILTTKSISSNLSTATLTNIST